METQELESVQIGEKYYVTITAATKYLHTSYGRIQDLITFGVIPITKIESRRLIELTFLKTFTMPPARRGRWRKAIVD